MKYVALFLGCVWELNCPISYSLIRVETEWQHIYSIPIHSEFKNKDRSLIIYLKISLYAGNKKPAHKLVVSEYLLSANVPDGFISYN